MKKMLFVVVITLLSSIISSVGCIEETTKNEFRFIYVDDDGGADFTLIQNAINYASDGDTIYVYNGTYNEQLIINNSINLIGESKDYTIINWQESSESSEIHIINIEADNCNIKDLKIIGVGSSSNINGINVNTSNNSITNNIILENYHGIILDKDTKNNNISSNIISNNLYGIYTDYSDDNYISKNNISLSIFDGIHLIVSNNNIIFGNTVTDNKFFGIRIKASDFNTVFGNLAVNNKGGVYCCCGSGFNIIYHNNFKQNIEWNGRDDINNQWDNGSVGNYWDDYNGTDADNNSIGDTPYYLTSLIKDEYPIMNPIEIYDIENL